MSIETLTEPVAPVATSTYATLDTEDANYTTTAGTTSGDNKTLALRMHWPDAGDTESPRPLVIHTCTTGWSSSDFTSLDSLMEQLYTSAGAICACINTRIISDDPLSTGEDSSMPAERRAINADMRDIDVALRYVLENYLEHANGVIEPSQIFLGGISSGAISSLAHTFIYPTRNIAGVIDFCGAFGVDGLGYTDYLRNDNNHRELYYRTPTCAFLGGADSTIGATYIELLRERIALDSRSIVHYDADGGHNALDFDVTALVGADTIYEAVSNFLIARCAAIKPSFELRRNALTWSRNWAKLESRFW